jgi:hypothetical protein
VLCFFSFLLFNLSVGGLIIIMKNKNLIKLKVKRRKIKEKKIES